MPVVDARVWVALYRPQDPNHDKAREYISRAVRGGDSLEREATIVAFGGDAE